MKSRVDLDAVRATSRRPLTIEEVPHAEALGAAVMEIRVGLGITRTAAADAALLSFWGFKAIETATRRTRRSTLARIADGLVRLADPDHEESLDADKLVERWVEVAGPALADESPWQARVERRARRRQRRKVQGYVNDARIEARARLLAERWLSEEEPW